MSTPAGWRAAVDAERADGVLPPHVWARSGLPAEESSQRVLAAWTQAEVIAKLTDTPILLRLRRFGLGLADLGDHAPILLTTHLRDGIIVTVGARRGEQPPLNVNET